MKFDGYRALAIRTTLGVQLRSRNNKDFNRRYPAVVKALECLPDQTVVDGELIALDGAGRPSFNALQNFDSAHTSIVYYVFDVLVLGGRDLTRLALAERRDLMRDNVLPMLSEPVRESPVMDARLGDLIGAVRAQGLEGLVAKRLDSRYESGQRTGAWQKMRINRGQEFVVGGYTTGANSFDALIFGYFESGRLIYAGRTRSGFTHLLRQNLSRLMKDLEIVECPFANLPEHHAGRWGQGLTAEKMTTCRWLRPVLVAQFEFVEWTPDNHLRHVKFVGFAMTRILRLCGGTSRPFMSGAHRLNSESSLLRTSKVRALAECRLYANAWPTFALD